MFRTIEGIPYKGIYREAFWKGYNYAYYGKGYEFGEVDALKHVPKKAKDKQKYITAWLDGNGMGVGD